MISELKRKLKNTAGSAKGYSGCSCCGDTWNWKKEHSIPYSDSGGMFPLCEECYQKLTPQERFDFCRKLWISWGAPDKVDFDRIAREVGLRSSAPSARSDEC